jgi:ribose 5-phosphate isomerase B
VVDFGDGRPKEDDDYPDFIVPLARAVAAGTVDRGVGICGSGVGASVCANKVAGVRACLIHENFSAHQGVEDDDLNLICFGGLVIGHALAWELLQTFLGAQFTGAERHRRRLAKVADLENKLWQVQVGRVKLCLLDSNDAANFPAHGGIANGVESQTESL